MACEFDRINPLLWVEVHTEFDTPVDVFTLPEATQEIILAECRANYWGVDGTLNLNGLTLYWTYVNLREFPELA